MDSNFFKGNVIKFVKCALVAMIVGSSICNIGYVKAAEFSKIDLTESQISGKSSSNHGPELAIDGNKQTYYQTPAYNQTDSHYRYVDIALNGLYEIKEIKIFNNEGTYNHYQIYASENGEDFKKIAYKADDNIPSLEEGTTHTLKQTVKATNLRINLTYNSAGMEGNLAEVEIYGNKIGEAKKVNNEIVVSDFEDTKWKTEYDKVAGDQSYANQKTVNEMREMVGRVIGENWKNDFVFKVKDFDGKNMYEINNTNDGKIVIQGNNGVSLAAGWNYYLRYYCNIDYNPMFVSNLKMPESLPKVEKKITKETEYDVRYALNFCTYSYTMAFWDWNDYEAFLDWAAMSGINLMLDIVGQEEIIRRTLSEYGYTNEEIKEYIAGPGYFAWYYMQNMTSYGGPLPNDWFEQRVELGRKIHDRMQTFGITPVLSGFSGMVPKDFKEKHSDAVIVSQGDWCGFLRPDMLRVYVNEGEKNYFNDLADTFYEAQKAVFGDITDYYAVDPFHEGGNMEDMNATTVYTTVQEKLLEHDPNGIWVIQQWGGSLNDAKLQGLKEKNHALVLDLSSEYNSYASVMERNEIPWVWNMIHEFGGKLGMEANVEAVSQKIPAAKEQYNYMKGIGMVPESIGRVPMIYEMLWDMAWTKDPIDPMEWGKKYMIRRYGDVNDELMQAWELLLQAPYNGKSNEVAEALTNARPTENYNSTTSWGSGKLQYKPEILEKVYKIYLENYDKFKNNDCFKYDLVDMARQVLSNSSQEYHKLMMNAYRTKDIDRFTEYSDYFLDLIQLQDDILSTNDNFQTGAWIDKSRTMINGADDWTKDLFEFNARSLITTWGGKNAADNGGLRDYSYRQWAGITKDYYMGRWQIWVEEYKNALKENRSPKSINWFNFEWEWANRKSDEGFAYSVKSDTKENLKTLADKVYNEFTISNADNIAADNEESGYGNLLAGKIAKTDNFLDDDEKKSLTDNDTNTGWTGENKDFPVSFEYDLNGTAVLEQLSFTMRPIVASGIKMTYKIEVEKDGEWKEIASDVSHNLPGQITIDYKGDAEKIRFTFESKDSGEVPEFKEFTAYGTIKHDNYINAALGAKGEMRQLSAQNWENAPNITDGNYETKDEVKGSLSVEYRVDLENNTLIDHTVIHFEKAGIRFKFNVYGETADGQKDILLDMSENLMDMQQSYRISVGKEYRYIGVEIFDRAPGGDFYLAAPLMFEIEAFQKASNDDIVPLKNVALNKIGKVKNNSTGEETTSLKMTDGNISTRESLEGPGYSFVPSEFSVDLGKSMFVQNATVYFEKAGLSFQFKIDVIDKEGKRRTVLDNSKLSKIMEAKYTIDINDTIQGILVEFTGRGNYGNAYLAASSVAEFEVMASPESLSKQATITSSKGTEFIQLNDNDESTGIEISDSKDKEIYFTFEKSRDFSMIEIVKADSNPLRYKLSYQESSDEWITLIDESKNIIEQARIVENFKKAVYTKKFKLELLDESVTLNEIRLYKKDYSDELLSKINNYIDLTKNFVAGEYAGNYGVTEYDAFMNKVSELNTWDLSDLNSDEVEKIVTEIKILYMNLKLSYVTIDRTDLLTTIMSAKTLLDGEYTFDKTALQSSYQEAQKVNDTYKVTQAQVNDAVAILQAEVEKVFHLLSLEEKLNAKLQIAKNLADNAAVGDKEGNVSQESLNKFNTVIIELEEAKANAITEYSIQELLLQLETAVNEFNNARVVINKADLLEIIAKAESLNQKDYDKDDWTALQEIYKEASALNEKEDVGMGEIQAITKKLSDAIDHLKKLNRNELEKVIQDAEKFNKANYTLETWSKMEAALQKAKSCINKESTNQEEINHILDELSLAIKGLKEKPIVLPEDPGNSGGNGNTDLSNPNNQGNSSSIIDTADFTDISTYTLLCVVSILSGIILFKIRKDIKE